MSGIKEAIKSTKLGNYFVKRRQYKRYFPDEKFLIYPKKTYLEILNIVTSARCSLRCKNCNNFIPAYTYEKGIDTEKLITSMKTIDACIEQYGEICISGGEPFLNPKLCKVLDAIPYKKAKRVKIDATGIFMPNDEIIKKLKEKNISVTIILFAPEMEQVKIAGALRNKGVKVNLLYKRYSENYGWKNDDEEGARALRKQVQKCRTGEVCLLDGYLYRCSRCAHGDKLGLYSIECGNSKIDIENKSIETLKCEINKLVWKTNYSEACKHCNRGTDAFVKVEKGIQLGESEEYSFN